MMVQKVRLKNVMEGCGREHFDCQPILLYLL